MRHVWFGTFAPENRVDEQKMAASLKGMSYGSIVGELHSVEQLTHNIAALKKYIAANNRFGIPILCMNEALHGVQLKGATTFPQALALSSTFNTELMNRVAGKIADEARAIGIDQVLAPVLDLSRELRWGRVEENYGEDPYLTGRMGVAYVKAFNERGVICTPKHFTAHGSPLGGLNLASVAGSDHDLYSIYLKPFADVIREAHPYSIMNAYSSYDGEPMAASHRFLTEILRDQLGFQGYVTSDWGSIGMLHNFQKVAKDEADAAMQAALAGLDVEVAGGCYNHLDSLVRCGALPESAIDNCVRHVLTAKFAMGLFDKPNIPDETKLKERVHTVEAVHLALEAARESAILLKNEKNILPLDLKKLKSIAVIGPNAAQIQFGGYSWTNDNQYGVTPLQGIKAQAGKVKVNYAKGCGIWEQDKSGFKAAVSAAKASDVALLFVGTCSMPPDAVSGEGFDLSDLRLPGVQEDLIKAVAATGKPVVVVFVSGKPLAIPWVKEHIPGIIVQWYGGEQQGNAIADVLFGKVNPSGRLNVSFPQSTGHIPCFYNYLPSDKGLYKQPGTPQKPGRDYIFATPAPLWAFGTGLSYTTFEYKNLNVKEDRLHQNGTIRLSVDVTNIGSRDGKEVVQLYVNDVVSSVATPVKELKRFTKVFIPKGETKTVEFELPVSELALYDKQMHLVVEPGDFELQVGAAADNILLKKTIEVY
jgi:beta-glucosidase